MTLDFARTIGDGYPEYVDDELGYNYHAWEVISASESKAHQQIKRADYSELDALADAFHPLSDLLRWAMARRHLRQGERPRYFEAVRHLIEGDKEHPALHYPEIMVDMARRLAEDGNLDESRQWLTRLESTWPEFQDAIPLVGAQLLIFAGRFEQGHQAFENALEPHGDDVDLRIETARDFQRMDAIDFARKWLRRARALAEELGDTASLVDIDLMERSLAEDEGDTSDSTVAD